MRELILILNRLIKESVKINFLLWNMVFII
uniref:Uncharacterized protein n=1 Tax=Siphoviridae sp. ctB3v5 TaxID=2826186 RepID=A0A8S5M8Z4_9CAUD|nr:MAG TPA: hypothetical protein [Siphoviridae sp. ctB3v5]